MKISSISISNFRALEDVTISLDDYTCLVGPNGGGKSTILYALNIFFREATSSSQNYVQLDEEDFHQRNTANPISITVTFTDLSEAAQSDFVHYYRQGRLVVSAVAEFNPTTGKADVKQFGQRLGMPDFRIFFEATSEGKKVAELKVIYNSIREKYSDLPSPGTKDAMIKALQDYEAAHSGDSELIPSEDQFYGVSKGTNRLEKYLQWVYVPAVKDATGEQVEARNTALGKLLARTVRSKIDFDKDVLALRERTQEQYQDLLDGNQGALNEISESLGAKLSEWSHPDTSLRLEWRQDPEKSVRIDQPLAGIVASEGNFEGELSRFGHGLQRSYILALLQELAGCDDSISPRLILGCEEPELYQHPPQVRHMASVLQNLSTSNSQILISTHSPHFVSGKVFESVRMVRKDETNARSLIYHLSYEEIVEEHAKATGEEPRKLSGTLAKVQQALKPSLNEMFFTPRLILVEGSEDIAYITTYLNLMQKWDEYRRLRCHLVPTNGKSEMALPLIIAKGLKIPTFLLFDADSDKPDKNGSRSKHEKDNNSLLSLCGIEYPDPFPDAIFWGNHVVMWHSEIASVVKEDFGQENWVEYGTKADADYGHVGDLHKNPLHIGTRLTFAWEDGLISDNLKKLCEEILNFGGS